MAHHTVTWQTLFEMAQTQRSVGLHAWLGEAAHLDFDWLVDLLQMHLTPLCVHHDCNRVPASRGRCSMLCTALAGQSKQWTRRMSSASWDIEALQK